MISDSMNIGNWDNFLKLMVELINRKYNIKCSISQGISYDNPYGEFNVTWDDCIVKVSNDLGPARQKDFIEQFDREIKNRYPEYFL
jgi:hypothetical protein